MGFQKITPRRDPRYLFLVKIDALPIPIGSLGKGQHKSFFFGAVPAVLFFLFWGGGDNPIQSIVWYTCMNR